MRECLRYPLPLHTPPSSPSTSIIHCPFLYVLLMLNPAPLQPGTDVFEFTLAFMCTSFHTVLCRVEDQKAIAHVRTGRSQVSTKEQLVVNVWLWRWGNKQAVAFLCVCVCVCMCDLVIPWGFALCQAIPRKIRMWNRALCGWWQDRRRWRWGKADECILRPPPLFLLSPAVPYSARAAPWALLAWESSLKLFWAGAAWARAVGSFLQAHYRVQYSAALAVCAQAWPAVGKDVFGAT